MMSHPTLDLDEIRNLVLNVTDYAKEINAIKLQTHSMLQILEGMDSKLNRRCNHINALTLSATEGAEMQSIIKELKSEFINLAKDVKRAKENADRVLEMYTSTASETASGTNLERPQSMVRAQRAASIAESSMILTKMIADNDSDSVASGTIKKDFIKKYSINDVKLTQNLNTLITMVETLMKDNKILKDSNKLLKYEIREMMRDYVEEETIIPVEKKGTPSEISDTDFQQVKLMIKELRGNKASNFYTRSEESLSHTLLRPQDKSFQIDEGETQEFTKEEWLKKVKDLKRMNEEMTICEMRIMTKKAIANQRFDN